MAADVHRIAWCRRQVIGDARPQPDPVGWLFNLVDIDAARCRGANQLVVQDLVRSRPNDSPGTVSHREARSGSMNTVASSRRPLAGERIARVSALSCMLVPASFRQRSPPGMVRISTRGPRPL